MSYQGQLIEEINRELNRLAAEGSEWKAGWVAHAICREHFEGLTDNDHEKFWRHCGYRSCREEVRRCINTRIDDQPEPRSDPQMRLPGFEHLQSYYLVHRGNDDVGVAINKMTSAEICEKASRYRTMGKACYAHADELMRYLATRSEVDQGAEA